MDYTALVWDPYYNTDIYKLQKVQRRAARWIVSDYSRNSVTSLSSLGIPTLQQHRKINDILQNTLPILIPSHY